MLQIPVSLSTSDDLLLLLLISPSPKTAFKNSSSDATAIEIILKKNQQVP
jgi:hypothetical protein